jgi:hypothetical protein
MPIVSHTKGFVTYTIVIVSYTKGFLNNTIAIVTYTKGFVTYTIAIVSFSKGIVSYTSAIVLKHFGIFCEAKAGLPETLRSRLYKGRIIDYHTSRIFKLPPIKKKRSACGSLPKGKDTISLL